MLMGGAQKAPKAAQQERLKETVMDKLIERELLVERPSKLGFVVTDEQVEDEIAESRLIVLGYAARSPRGCRRTASSTTSRSRCSSSSSWA